MNSRERIIAALQHRESDRIPITDTTYWPETIERWEKEGLPKGMHPNDYFNMDKIFLVNPIDAGFSNIFPYEVYEETDEYKIDRNPFGVKVKYWKHKYATHVELEHAVKCRKDWDEIKRYLSVSEKRLKIEEIEKTHDAYKNGLFVCLTPLEPFWFSFVMMGVEELMVQMATAQEFIADMYNYYTDFLIEMLEKVISKGVYFDGIWFFSDMCYKNGPLFSPEFYNKFLLPCHSRISEFCHRRNKFLLLHCDGYVGSLIPGFIHAGFDAIQPLEVRAGNDIRIYKNMYGDKICLFGNISADILAKGDKDAIEEEIRSKISMGKKNGGYIYHIDHSVPPTISFSSYVFALECVHKYGKF